MDPSQNLVIWAGPVSAQNLSGAALPVPARVLTVNEGVGGVGSTAFGDLGRRYDGSLAELCAARGVDLDRCRTVTLCCFSAGFALVELLLRNEQSAARVDALVAGDGYYTSAAMNVKPGYLAFCRRAAEGRALAVLSTSGIGGPSYPSSQEAVGKLLAGFDLVAAAPPASVPAPESALGRGGLLWLRYGAKYGLGKSAHVMHATRVVPGVLSDLVTPYLQEREGVGGRAPKGAGAALAAAGLIIIASRAI